MYKSFEDIKKAIVAAYPDCLDNKRLADELAMSQTSLNYFLFESRKLPTEYLIPWCHRNKFVINDFLYQAELRSYDSQSLTKNINILLEVIFFSLSQILRHLKDKDNAVDKVCRKTPHRVGGRRTAQPKKSKSV